MEISTGTHFEVGIPIWECQRNVPDFTIRHGCQQFNKVNTRMISGLEQLRLILTHTQSNVCFLSMDCCYYELLLSVRIKTSSSISGVHFPTLLLCRDATPSSDFGGKWNAPLDFAFIPRTNWTVTTGCMKRTGKTICDVTHRFS